MRKIRLQLESLVVDSFATEPSGGPAGTVLANSGTGATNPNDTCGDTCYIGSCQPITCAGVDFCQHSYYIEECTSAGGPVTQCPTGSPWESECGPWSFQVGCTM
jgi:hypothetical protein